MKEVEVKEVDCDSRVIDRVPFEEGDTVTLRQKPAVGTFLWGENDSLSGKLHSDGKTFVYSEGIRSVEITVE
jgi:hypothetical protein